MFRLLLVILASLTALLTQASVDPKSGGYSHSWVDLKDNDNSQVGVRRTYNSKSSRVGIFGMGQCSQFETALSMEESGDVAFIHCGSGQVRIFSRKKQKSLGQLIATYKKKVPNFSELAFRKDHFYRLSLLKLNPRLDSPDKVPPNRYRSVDGNATMVATKSRVEVELEDGTTYTFNPEGQLRSIADFEKNYEIFYYENRPTKVTAGSKSMLFKYNSNGLVESISGDLRGTARYDYNGLYMSRATNGWGNTYGFKYNSKGNLSLISYPDGTKKKLRYDSKGKVVQFVDRKGCKEAYNYSKEDAFTEVFGVIKTCKGKEVVRATSKNSYRPDKAGYLRLASNLKVVNGQQTESLFDVKTGELIKRTQKDSPGKASATVRDYKYSKKKRPRQTQNQKVTVTTRSLATKGAPATTQSYKLNTANKVVAFEDSTGEKVTAKYNKEGLIQSLMGKKQPRIDLKYDGFQRPISISIKGKGRLRLKYDQARGRSLKVVEGSQQFTVALGKALKRYEKLLQIR